MRLNRQFGYPRMLNTVAASVIAAGSLALTQPASGADEPEQLITNTARFEIPFEVPRDQGKPAEGFAVLYGSQNSGKTWERLQSVPIARRSFVFTAPRDGHYSFAIRITDSRGSLLQPIEGSTPELDVFVDTIPPALKLEITEPEAGKAIVSWTTTDPSVNADSMTLEYSDGVSGIRRKVDAPPSATGEIQLPLPPGSTIEVRASITDQAGNRGEARKQYVSDFEPGEVAAQPDTTSEGTGKPAASLGPSPFFQDTPRPPGASAATAQSPPDAGGDESSPSKRPEPRKLLPLNVKSERKTAVTTPEPAPPTPAQTVTPDAPPSRPEPPQIVNGVQMVNNRIFNIEYQIDDVGPSGISSVELFVTEDGGKQWFRYGVDPDLKSPFEVDSIAEGTFGFAVRVRSGVGLAEIPPQPGQPPEIVISVDQTLPFIEMEQPTVNTDGEGAIRFGWQVVEANPAENSIRLESAQTPAGPWLPVFDWQPDQGSFELPVRSGLPTQMYFRLLARDTAGNVATSQTMQPVVVDLKKPVGRLLRVQPAAPLSSVRRTP